MTTPATQWQHTVLRETRRLAVPLHTDRMRGLPPGSLTAIASDCATTIGTHGDDLMFGGQHCKTAFNALARGLAAAALTADGGIDWDGLHWCAIPGCQAGSRYDHAEHAPRPPGPDTPPVRPVHALPDLATWTG